MITNDAHASSQQEDLKRHILAVVWWCFERLITNYCWSGETLSARNPRKWSVRLINAMFKHSRCFRIKNDNIFESFMVMWKLKRRKQISLTNSALHVVSKKVACRNFQFDTRYWKEWMFSQLEIVTKHASFPLITHKRAIGVH